MVNPINTHPHAVMPDPSYLETTTYIPWDKTSSPLNRLANTPTSHKLRVLKLRIGWRRKKTALDLLSTHSRGGYFPVIGLVHSAPFSTEVKEIILLHIYTPSGPMLLV